MVRLLRTRLTRVALFVGITLAVLAPAAAWAQNYPTPPPPDSPSCVYPYSDPSCTSTSTSTSEGQGSSLPFTGGNVALMTVIGTVVIGGGVALIMYSRRRSVPTT